MTTIHVVYSLLRHRCILVESREGHGLRRQRNGAGGGDGGGGRRHRGHRDGRAHGGDPATVWIGAQIRFMIRSTEARSRLSELAPIRTRARPTLPLPLSTYLCNQSKSELTASILPPGVVAAVGRRRPAGVPLGHDGRVGRAADAPRHGDVVREGELLRRGGRPAILHAERERESERG